MGDDGTFSGNHGSQGTGRYCEVPRQFTRPSAFIRVEVCSLLSTNSQEPTAAF